MGGAGKGRGKGKSKGKERQPPKQMRRAVASVVGEVLFSAGETEVKNPRHQTGNERWRAKEAAAEAQTPKSRKAQRRAQRQEHKQKRNHFFGEGRRIEKMELEREAAPAGKRKRGGDEQSEAKGQGKGKGKKGKPAKFSRRDDDDEITSEEEGEVGTKARSRLLKAPKKLSAKKAQAGADSEEEEADADEASEVDSAEDEDAEGAEEEDEAAGDEEDVESESDGEAEGAEGDAKAQRASGAGAGAAGGYVPPHLRGASAAAASRKAAAAGSAAQQLTRQLRGIMNRVTEGNLEPSGKELNLALGKVVPEVGGPAAAQALLAVLVPAAVCDPNISVLVVGCYAALACVAHVLYGSAFGGAALLEAGKLLQQRLPEAEASGESTGEDARIAKNCVVFECLLFSFGLLPGRSIFDMVRFIFEGDQVSEVRIDLALTTLRFAGRGLRAECAEDFKELLSFVSRVANTAKSKDVPEGSDERNRIDYLLRELQDLKNNKVSFAAMDRFEATRSWLKGAPVLSGRKVQDLRLDVPFKFLCEESPQGWPSSGKGSGTVLSKRSGSSAQPLREAAVAQRLSTDLRQSLFVAVMGAEDFEHAADRLAQVAAGAKTGTDEACLILFHCAIREKVPNPFYEHVALALCARPAPQGKRFAHCLKRAAVQHLTQVHTYGVRATVGLAELCAALVAAPDADLPLAMVRFVRFGETGASEGGKTKGKTLGLLLRHLTEALLKRLPDADAVAKVFGPLSKYEDVREGLLLVMDGLVKPRLPARADNPLMWEMFASARGQLANRAAREDDE